MQKWSTRKLSNNSAAKKRGIELIQMENETWINNEVFFVHTFLHASFHLLKEKNNFNVTIRCKYKYCEVIKCRLSHINNCQIPNCNFYLCNIVKERLSHVQRCVSVSCGLCTQVRESFPIHLLQILKRNPLVKQQLNKYKNV